MKKQGSLGGKGTEGSPDTQFMDKGVLKEGKMDRSRRSGCGGFL